MPVYKISKDDRCKILNIAPDLHDQAQRLIAERDNEIADALAQGVTSPPHLFWYDACRQVDPKTDHGKYHFLIDNGHGDHGAHMTMTFSRNVARMLERDLGIAPTFLHKVHHRPQDFPA